MRLAACHACFSASARRGLRSLVLNYEEYSNIYIYIYIYMYIYIYIYY